MKEFVLNNNEYFSKLIFMNYIYRLCKMYQTCVVLLHPCSNNSLSCAR